MMTEQDCSNLGRLSSLRLAVVPARAPEKTGQQGKKATGFCVAKKRQATVQPSGISRLSTDPDLPLRKPYVMCVGRRVVKHDLGTMRLRSLKSVAREGLLSEATDRYTVKFVRNRASLTLGCSISLAPSLNRFAMGVKGKPR